MTFCDGNKVFENLEYCYKRNKDITPQIYLLKSNVLEKPIRMTEEKALAWWMVWLFKILTDLTETHSSLYGVSTNPRPILQLPTLHTFPDLKGPDWWENIISDTYNSGPRWVSPCCFHSFRPFFEPVKIIYYNILCKKNGSLQSFANFEIFILSLFGEFHTWLVYKWALQSII